MDAKSIRINLKKMKPTTAVSKAFNKNNSNEVENKVELRDEQNGAVGQDTRREGDDKYFASIISSAQLHEHWP